MDDPVLYRILYVLLTELLLIFLASHLVFWREGNVCFSHSGEQTTCLAASKLMATQRLCNLGCTGIISTALLNGKPLTS